MRYRPEHNDATRERILEAASRLFREHGIAAVGLARVMAEADLTVGTFYTHFESKEALVREALTRSLADRHSELERMIPHSDMETAVRAYLSPEHRDTPGTGCPVASLASEVGRQPLATRDAFASGNAPTLVALARLLSFQRGETTSLAEAAVFQGLLVGTLQLARATPDRAQSDAILEAGVQAATRLAR